MSRLQNNLGRQNSLAAGLSSQLVVITTAVRLFLKGKGMECKVELSNWLVVAVLAAFIAWCVVGCHTIHGIGSDLKDATSDYVKRSD